MKVKKSYCTEHLEMKIHEVEAIIRIILNSKDEKKKTPKLINDTIHLASLCVRLAVNPHIDAKEKLKDIDANIDELNKIILVLMQGKE